MMFTVNFLCPNATERFDTCKITCSLNCDQSRSKISGPWATRGPRSYFEPMMS